MGGVDVCSEFFALRWLRVMRLHVIGDGDHVLSC
jgi:hypothetical protein